MATGGADGRRDRSMDRSRNRSRDRSSSADRSVDSRVVCIVCLEPYRGRQPKLLPCFHTFCLQCLAQLAHKPSQASGDDGQKSDSCLSITCPACRTEVPVPPGGVADFQSNFYLSDEPPTSVSPPPPGATAARVTMATEQEDDIKVKVRSQVKVMEAVLRRLAEEEGEITQQKQALDHEIQIRYSAALRHLGEARDQSLISLREAAQAAQDRLEADKSTAEFRLHILSQTEIGAGNAPQSGLLSEAALRHFQQTAQRKGEHRYFTYPRASENTAQALADACQRFMSTVQSVGHSTRTESSLDKGCGEDRHRQSEEQQRQNASVISTEVLKLRHELTALQTQNSQLQEDVTTLLADRGQLTRDVDALKKDVNSALADSTRLSTGLATLQTDLSSLRQDVASGKTDCKQKMATLDAELDSLKTDCEKKMKSFETDTKKIGSDVQGLQKNVGDLQKNITDLQINLVDVQTENGKVQTEVSSMKTHIASLQQEVVMVKTNNSQMGTGPKGIQKDIDNLRQDVVSVKTDNSQMDTRLKGIQKAVDNLKKRLATVEKENSKLDTMGADIFQLHKDVAEVKAASSRVAFHARLKSKLSTNKTRKILKFGIVGINIGDGYDPNTGIFTAPVSGIYIFMATAGSQDGSKTSRFSFVLEELRPQGFVRDSSLQGVNLCWTEATGTNSGSCHAVVKLDRGRRAWIESGTLGNFCFDNSYTFFTGALLYESV